MPQNPILNMQAPIRILAVEAASKAALSLEYRLNPAQVDEQYLRAEFAAADADGNGVLDVQELRALLNKMGYVTEVPWCRKKKGFSKDVEPTPSSLVWVGGWVWVWGLTSKYIVSQDQAPATPPLRLLAVLTICRDIKIPKPTADKGIPDPTHQPL